MAVQPFPSDPTACVLAGFSILKTASSFRLIAIHSRFGKSAVPMMFFWISAVPS
jgi:hypothetical protein